MTGFRGTDLPVSRGHGGTRGGKLGPAGRGVCRRIGRAAGIAGGDVFDFTDAKRDTEDDFAQRDGVANANEIFLALGEPDLRVE